MAPSQPSFQTFRSFGGSASTQTGPSRKRKAEHVSASDEGSHPRRPNTTAHQPHNDVLAPITANRVAKRARRNRQPRQLHLARILEPLDAAALRNVIESICIARPDVHQELLKSAPRPSAEECMKLLTRYETEFRNAFPFGGSESSDYSFNRVQPQLMALLDALKDYTPSFLPPIEPQDSVSLTFLDGVTEMVHRIPQWESFENNRFKDDAYDDLSEGWATVIRAAAKRGTGFEFVSSGWDTKLAKHNALSGNKLESAIHEMKSQLAWLGTDSSCGPAAAVWNPEADTASIRQQLFNGTYGHGTPVQVGPW